MGRIILFGGTAEGRTLAAALLKKRVPTLVCVATDYGRDLLEPDEFLEVQAGRLNTDAIVQLLQRESPRLVIDSTHPYAIQVSRSLRSACESTGTEYIRVVRRREDSAGCLEFPDMSALVEWLDNWSGIVFSTLGAKEAAQLSKVSDYKNRVWLRILPSVDGLTSCLSAGFPGAHIICMQGPFSEELNTAMFHASGASILVTKESGTAGGFPEKIAAAKKLGMEIALLARPQEGGGIYVDELLRRIEDGNI